MLAFIKPAFSLNVDSMVKIAAAGSRGITYTIQGSDSDHKIEAECYTVTMDDAGKESYQECDEKYVLYPAIFDLSAQQKRAVRVSNLSGTPDQEIAIRVFFGELPSPQHQQGVELLSRLGCWLFFQPHTIDLRASGTIKDHVLYIDNQSNVHLRPVGGELVTNHGRINISEMLKQTPRILAKHQRNLPLPAEVIKQFKHDTIIKEVSIILESGRHLHLPML